MAVRFRQRISYRQARNTVLVAFLLGTVLSIIQISYELFKERKRIDSTVSALIEMLRESATQSVYDLDRSLARKVIQGLFEYEPIRVVQVVDESETILASDERPVVKGRFQWLVELIFGKEKNYTVPLLYGSQQRVVGHLNVSIDIRLIARDFFGKAGLIIISDLIRNIVLSTALTLLFYSSLTRPLLEMVKRVAAVDIHQPADELLKISQGHENDELGLLIRTTNMLLERLGESLAKHRAAQKELEEHRDHLEQLVEQRTIELRELVKELEKAKGTAETANLAKTQFLSNMSHELRTPLNVILGFVQLMARNPQIPVDAQENLEIIQRSGDHLLTLINQVLDLSKIEAGQITLNEKEFDLHHLLDDLNNMFSLKAQHKGLHLLFDCADDVSRYIRTDEVKLRQVLMNLLNNAIKFTQEGGVALRVKIGDHVETGRRPVSTTRLLFEIEDTGPGIALDEMDNLFEAFVQTKTGRDTQEGTGLGLPISRKFVQLLGGDIAVRSEVGRGTTFTFEIPARVGDATDIATRLPDRRVIALESDQPRYRLLIVDDQPDNRKLLVKLLNPYGFDLREAANGQEAIEIWDHWKPHLIWMDLRMPVLDGYEATKRIRNEELKMRNKDLSELVTRNSQLATRTVIIAVTASSFEEERAVMLAAGCDAFLRKPFREADVFEMLHKHRGVRFVYEEQSDVLETKVGEPCVLTPEALSALPEEVRTELQQAIEVLNLENTNHLIAQIRQQNAPLAEALAALVKQYRFDTLQSLFNETGE